MITRERFIELLSDDSFGNWKGDNAFQGLQIIAKYISAEENTLLVGANHDIIYSVDVDKLIEAGITEDDATAFRHLNWMVEDDSYLACFV